MSAVGERIKALRQARELSQRELAEMVGAHQTAISFVEKGERPPSRDLAKKLAHVLGIEAQEMARLMFEYGEEQVAL